MDKNLVFQLFIWFLMGLICIGAMIFLFIMEVPPSLCMLAFGLYAGAFCMVIIVLPKIIKRKFK